MKIDLFNKFTLGLLVSFSLLGLSQAQSEGESDAARVGILPTQKIGVLVPSDAPNPFAQAAKKEELRQETGKELSEEDRIRAVFSQLRVSGGGSGPNGMSYLVGDLILEKGVKVPQLLENQTEQLVVTSVTDTEIEITWIEKPNHKGEARRLVIPVDLTPKVRYVLRGQPANENPRLGVDLLSDRGASADDGRHWATGDSETSE